MVPVDTGLAYGLGLVLPHDKTHKP
jgi:hypothetical protein